MGEEEEELLLLQSRALAEDEEAKTKRKLLSQFLKDKLAKEKRSSTLNLHKLHTRWQRVLREAKAQTLRQDVEILSQTFSRVMDSKNRVIESLLTELEQAEEQHSRALGSHLHNMERLLEIQRSHLEFLEEGYSSQLEALKLDFEAERTTLLELHERESLYLSSMASAMEHSYTQSTQEATQSFQSTQADFKSKSLCEQQYSRSQLNRKAEELREQLQGATQSYSEATEHPRVAFEALKQKDRASAREMKKQAKKLQKLQDSIVATKGQVAAQRRRNEEQKRRAREEKEEALRQLQELKRMMIPARMKAQDDLTRLSVQSGSALKSLEQVVRKARWLLQLAELCRRLETREEKVLPFHPSSPAGGEQREAPQTLQEPPAEPLAQVLRDYAGLERFWQRLNKVKLEEQALLREREALKEGNRRLRELLRRYLAGISAGREALGDPNPLLTPQRRGSAPQDPAPGLRGALQPVEKQLLQPGAPCPAPGGQRRGFCQPGGAREELNPSPHSQFWGSAALPAGRDLDAG